MTWLTPLLGGIAAAILVPSLVILYFLKLKRREVEVSTTLLWKKSIEDLQANAPFQRLRKNILLLLQLLALAAGLLALAQPEIRTEASPGERIVILIDRSASMSANDGGADGDESRLEQARREAIQLVESLREPGVFDRDRGDEAMVIAFDDGAEVVQSFTADKDRLAAAINAIAPTDAPSAIDEAMRLAGAYTQPTLEEDRGLVETPGAPIHLWSDGRVSDAARVAMNRETPLTFHAVGGAATPNLGIVACRAERSYEEAGRAQVFVGVQSTDPAPREVDVELAVDGVVSAIRTVRLPGAAAGAPGDTSRTSTSGVVFTLNESDAALLSIRLLADDALTADNRAWLALPPAKRLAVLYVGSAGSLLEDLIAVTEPSRLVTATREQFERLAASGGEAEFDVIVLDGWAPQDILPAGRYLVFNAAPPLEGVQVGAPVEDMRVIIDWSREHPALRSVSMENLYVAKRRPIEPGDAATTLAQSDEGAAIVEIAEGATRAIVIGFDILDTNWVWDHNLVLFIASSLRYLGDESSRIVRGEARPGGVLSTRLPTDASEVELALPGGERATLQPGADGRVNFGPIRETGLYRLRWRGSPAPEDRIVEGRPQRIIAANLLDPLESDI
ncbi:MAG: VWA domain-containing protein, partial [Planctomycetota bacterium]|nr:VWA domain-containing protein [Planctomycetota bacterium]